MSKSDIDKVSFLELMEINKTVDTLYKLVEHQNKILLYQINRCHPSLHRVLAKFINLNMMMIDNLLAVMTMIKQTENEVFSELNGKSA